MFFPFPIQLGLCGLLRLRWLSAICRHIDTLVGGRRLACWYGIPRSDARRLSWGVPRPNPLFNGILVETGLFRWGFHQWQVATILLIAQGWLQKRKDPQLNVLWVFIFLFPKKSCSTIDWYATKPVFFALYKKHLGVDRVSLFGEQFNPIYWIPNIDQCLDCYTHMLGLFWYTRQMRIRVGFKRFTATNTGLDKANKYPELSSTFKAAFIKSSMWFFCKNCDTDFWESSGGVLFKQDFVYVYLCWNRCLRTWRIQPHFNMFFMFPTPRTSCWNWLPYAITTSMWLSIPWIMLTYCLISLKRMTLWMYFVIFWILFSPLKLMNP